jgi:hypothetical protein
MRGLELAQRQHVDFTGDAVIVVATFDAQDVTFLVAFRLFTLQAKM